MKVSLVIIPAPGFGFCGGVEHSRFLILERRNRKHGTGNRDSEGQDRYVNLYIKPWNLLRLTRFFILSKPNLVIIGSPGDLEVHEGNLPILVEVLDLIDLV